MYSKHFGRYLLISQLFSWEFKNFVCIELRQRTENMRVCMCVFARGCVCVRGNVCLQDYECAYVCVSD